ncbi:MAG: 50S ribosomal protein L32 [Candidatus Magasanikbacteria bacterium CG11_big_fil_rev_8_21_14_0_20_39_34]|uniref:Large ribosomal subunit protein bL32 n=1 Tax=Candidatus Magasanikbacteria bacterium CG11_big_fil_rev_8_21_14_0_20_39_34 TaxID=1974653 RepID=A0A2H0N3M8_9BACT|nr:MAG: 50S ribosomal protein L32 [Candidatus Magasanikbacteria bacterium CG11_big_fil_rev_8_21_14_0_20_39_34]
MGLPAKRRTRTSKKDRASHFALKGVQVRYDEAGNAYLPHTVNPKTGKYKDRQVVDTQKRTQKLLQKAKKLSK